MHSPEEAKLRHASHYFRLLDAENRLYQQGNDNIKVALRAFDIEWTNIKAAQEWAANSARSNLSAIVLCSLFPSAGSHLLGLRQSPKEMISCLKTALIAALSLKDFRLVCAHLSNATQAYIDMGWAKKAIRTCEEGLRLSRKIGYRDVEASLLYHIGLAYYSLGQAEPAIKFYKKSLKLAYKFPIEEERLLYNLALVSPILLSANTKWQFAPTKRQLRWHKN